MKTRIISLNKENTNEASALLLNVFKNSSPEDDDYPPKWLNASLEPENNKALYAKLGVKYLKYWVAINDGNKVIGIIGLYTLDYDEEEACWLGWYCVEPNLRGKGIGKTLLDFVITKARKDGKKWLRLYTSNDPNERKANEIYDKLGFGPIKDKKINAIIKGKKFRAFTKNLVYKELIIK